MNKNLNSLEYLKSLVNRTYAAGLALWEDNQKARASNKQLRFLSQAAVLEEAALPYHFKVVMLTISSCIVILIILASLISLKEIARTTGEIIPTGLVQQIQHLEGGSISDILVQEGQLVESGQLLIRIAGETAHDEMKKASAKDTTLRLQSERYRSFANLEPAEFEKIAKDFSNLAADQRQILESMRESRDKQRKVILDQLDQRRESLRQAESKLATLEKNVKLAKETKEVKQDLYKRGFGSRTSALDAEKEHNNLEGEIEKTKSEIAQGTQNITEFETRLKSLESSLRDEALQKLAALENDLIDNTKVIEKFGNQIARLDIKSPVKGIVKGLEISKGAVVGPGQKIMEIVPVDESLIAEVKINPSDIGNLNPGQDSIVKVSAYDFSRHGSIDGKLIYLSATTFTNKDGLTYYKGRIKLEKNHVGNNPNLNIVLPGMVVSADIITGEKTIVGYLLKPIQVALSTALREK